MRCIGIIGAMDQEVAGLKEMMEEVKIARIASMEFYEGLLEGKRVVVVQSGIGKTNAAVCTQILIDIFHAEVVINTGVAGSLNPEINIGDIVVSTEVLHHDMDGTEFGYPKGQTPGMKDLSFPADDALRSLAVRICREVNPEIEVFEGRIASGDQFISNQKIKDEIVKNFGAYATEMEGAAIGQAAYLNKVPFLVIRAISDKADGSAHVDYKTFEAAAIRHSVKLTSSMIRELQG